MSALLLVDVIFLLKCGFVCCCSSSGASTVAIDNKIEQAMVSISCPFVDVLGGGGGCSLRSPDVVTELLTPEVVIEGTLSTFDPRISLCPHPHPLPSSLWKRRTQALREWQGRTRTWNRVRHVEIRRRHHQNCLD